MPQTQVRGSQILNNTVQRQDLDTSTVGQAVVTKLVQGSNVTFSSTGADAGTGDVTINVASVQGPTGPAGPAGTPAWTTASAGFTIPAIGSTVVVTVADPTWMTVGEFVYVAGASGSGQAGTLQITNITGNQVTLLNAGGASGALISSDAGNYAKLGSDNLVFVPNALASTSARGLLSPLSGAATDFVGGDNTTHSLVTALLGYLVPTGAVIDYAGATAPTGFLLAQGQAVSRTTYSGLYTALGGAGSPWGQGDGSTTFNVPDLRSRVPVGAGQGTGLSNYALAATGGEETHRLVQAEMPSHMHYAMSNPVGYAGGSYGAHTSCASTGNSVVPCTSAGSDGAHNNIQPYLVMNKIIKT